jgi:hypothetical protein
MASLVRALVIALIAVITAWSVAQAASTTSMSLDMSFMTAHDTSAIDKAHCHECDCEGAGGGVGLLCEMSCVSPAFADLTVSFDPAAASLASTLHVVMPTADLRGRADPPEPFPPRVLLLT